MFFFDDFSGHKILKSTLLKDYNCFFTTRDFVLTEGNRSDLRETSLSNRKILENLTDSTITSAVQVHGCNIEKIDNRKFLYDNTDALISDIPGALMLLNFADCVPVILYDKKINAAAVVHAGWRGTASQIAFKTVLRMNHEFGSDPENITALIGPAISKCCFETDFDVFDKLISDKNDTRLFVKKADKFFIDLKLLNYIQLEKSGVKCIDMCDYCTSCMSGIFFSYRKENAVTARHSAVVQIKRE